MIFPPSSQCWARPGCYPSPQLHPRRELGVEGLSCSPSHLLSLLMVPCGPRDICPSSLSPYSYISTQRHSTYNSNSIAHHPISPLSISPSWTLISNLHFQQTKQTELQGTARSGQPMFMVTVLATKNHLKGCNSTCRAPTMLIYLSPAVSLAFPSRGCCNRSGDEPFPQWEPGLLPNLRLVARST